MTKRGRKIDPSLPPSRSRDIQRAFRARRAAYIAGLEDRVRELELENRALKLRLGEDPGPIEEPEDDDPDAPRQPSYNLRVGPNARSSKPGASPSTLTSSVKMEASPTRPAIAVAIPATQPQEPYGYYMGPSSVPTSLPPAHPLASAPSFLPGSPLSVVSAPPTFLRSGQQQPSTGTPGEELPFWLDRFSLPPTPGEGAPGSFSLDDQRRFVLAPPTDAAYDPSRSALPNLAQSTLGRPPLSPALTSTSPPSGSCGSSGGEDGSPVNAHVKVEDEHASVLNHFGAGASLPDGVEPFGFGWSTSPFAPPFQTPPTNVPMPASATA